MLKSKMVNYIYNLRKIKTTTKALYVYSGNQKFGVFEGFYENTPTKILDYVLSNYSLINYRLKDLKGNNRMIIEDKTGLGKRKIQVTFVDNLGKKEIFMIEDKQPLKLGEHAEFLYRGESYSIEKEPMKPAFLKLDNTVIGEYKIHLLKSNVEITIKDSSYDDSPFFIIGVLHAFLYAND